MDETNYTNNISPMQVTESIEYARYRKMTKLSTFACVALAIEISFILYVLNIVGDFENTFLVSVLLGVMFGLAFIMSASVIATNVVKMKIIERGVGTLPVYKVVFNETYKSAWSAGLRFVVEIPDGSGRKVKTRDMFSPNKPSNIIKSRTYLQTLYADDFRGREVLIMYNPRNNRIYVLDYANRFSLPTETF